MLGRPLTHRLVAVLVAAALLGAAASPCAFAASAARVWNEELLGAIRLDRARPTVHARNLFHVSIAMWDAWSAYDSLARSYLVTEKQVVADGVEAARSEAIAYAAYRILVARFAASPNAATVRERLDTRMAALGYDPALVSTAGDSPAALGNRIAAAVLAFGLSDGANEQNGYAATNGYVPVNPPLVVALPGTEMVDPNRWQPLALDFFVDQSGIVLGAYPPHLTPHWTAVAPFGLVEGDRSPSTHFDPGPPPLLGGAGSAAVRENVLHLLELSSHLDPDDGVVVDRSPGGWGNRALGSYDGPGHAVNPLTGEAYAPNEVKRGDWARVLAEFWADGPDSETPPGHWNTIANKVVDSPGFVRRLGGVGRELDALEWDVKMYLVLNGALHDAAICAWGAKGFYDTSRPVSLVRYMAGRGQSSEPAAGDYDPQGLPLVPGLVERITFASSAPGERHAHLASYQGELAVLTWPGAPANPESEYSGVDWFPALDWVPYQRPTFVSPPFAGYVSGHSTFSRAAAEVLTTLSGSAFFPGGLGRFVARQNEYLQFEAGPSEEVELQWATYYDAADDSGLSRIYGGIHPRQDDIPGRLIGGKVGRRACLHARQFLFAEGDEESRRAALARDCLREMMASGALVLAVAAPGAVLGVVSPEELQALDANDDGTLVLAELLDAAGGRAPLHRADTDGDARLSLSEVLRGVQLFNLGGYHCAAGPASTEDGFQGGVDGPKACTPHDADYAPSDWVLGLSELLRLIQFYNAGAYVACPATEDGYCPSR